MRSVISCVLVASVTGAVAFPAALRAQDYVAAIKRDCDAGKVEACHEVAGLYQYGRFGFTKDLPQAARLFEIACNGGVAYSCRSLGQMYRDGQGVPADTARADSLLERTRSLHRRACELGSTTACYGLQGMGGPEAIDARQRLCDLLDGDACLRLGLMYDLGVRGVPKDTARATVLFKKGCLSGNKDACNLIRR